MRDLVIIGAGPGGLSAAIYAVRYKLDFLIIGKEIGGALNKAQVIENYLGLKHVSGKDLVELFKEQINYFKIKVIEEDVTKIEKIKDYFMVYYKNNRIEIFKKLIRLRR